MKKKKKINQSHGFGHIHFIFVQWIRSAQEVTTGVSVKGYLISKI